MKYLDLAVDIPPRARHPMQEFCRESEAMGRVELIADQRGNPPVHGWEEARTLWAPIHRPRQD